MKHYRNRPRLAGTILLTWVCFFKRTFDCTYRISCSTYSDKYGFNASTNSYTFVPGAD